MHLCMRKKSEDMSYCINIQYVIYPIHYTGQCPYCSRADTSRRYIARHARQQRPAIEPAGTVVPFPKHLFCAVLQPSPNGRRRGGTVPVINSSVQQRVDFGRGVLFLDFRTPGPQPVNINRLMRQSVPHLLHKWRGSRPVGGVSPCFSTRCKCI